MTVSIFDGHSRLQLARAGDPETGYPRTSYPTQIAVTSGALSATVEASAQNYAMFLEELSELHKSMAGEARLQFWDEAHSIVLTGDGSGRISLEVTIINSGNACLRVTMAIDQSYLPEAVSALREEFPI